MKRLMLIVFLAFLFCLSNEIMAGEHSAYEGWEKGYHGSILPFIPNYEIVSYNPVTGNLMLKLMIQYNPDTYQKATCDLLTLGIYTRRGLKYTGPDTLYVPYKSQNPYTTFLDLTVPPNDTSCLSILLDYGKIHLSSLSFVTTGDTITTFSGEVFDPNNPVSPLVEATAKHYPIPQEDYERAKQEWEEKQKQKPVIPPEGIGTYGPVLSPEDSVIYNDLSDRGKKLFTKMRHLERRGPRTESNFSVMEIDGQWYRRDSGEVKFRQIKAKTSEELFEEAKRYEDSLKAHPPKDTYNLILDLRDPEDYDYAKSLLDSLMPTDSVGYYRAIMGRPTRAKLKERGIKYDRADRHPRHKRRHHDKKQSESSVPVKSAKDILFSERFEENWPGAWSVYDDDSDSGLDYWGKSDCDIWSGDWSGWCAEESNLPECAHYDNCMYAIMEMTEPVDISQYINPQLSFWLYCETEQTYDYFECYGSVDGYHWVLIQPRFTGFFDWAEVSGPIQKTTGNYYIRFLFRSDYSDSEYCGAFLDDIEVTGDPAVQPNLTWDQPAFWDGPIVVSTVSGTNTDTTLYGGEPVYIDWAMWNFGDGDAAPFHVGLYLDGSLLHEWFVNGLDSYTDYNKQDYEATISEGYHTLKLCVDNRDEVQESDEYDNVYEQGFYWDPPEITYTGHVYYWDMNPPATTKPARGIEIVMYDKDGSGEEQLAATVTDYTGYFKLGPVQNNNDTQDKGAKQDIYFRIYSEASSSSQVANSDGFPFRQSTPIIPNHPSGVFDTSIQISQGISDAFFVADVILEGQDTCMNNHNIFIPSTSVLFDTIGTTYRSGLDTLIYIDTSSSGYHPETWDRDIILHEYGHRVADYYGFLWSDTGQHSWNDTLTTNLASTEAWADFFAAWVTGDPIIEDNNANFQNVAQLNCETGEWGINGAVYGSANQYGEYTEGAIAGILWDIFDQSNDDYDGDGIGDTLSDGVDNILDVLLHRTVNGHHAENIGEFWDAWFQSSSKGHLTAMQDIWKEHGISAFVCGDANSDGIVNVGDVTYIINYIFKGGPVPTPLESGNVNCDGVVNTGDAVYLVVYIFKGGAEPCASCP